MSSHFIRGKACSDYTEKLDHLAKTPIKPLTLNEDSFTNWVVNKIPVHNIREVYDEFGKLILQDG